MVFNGFSKDVHDSRYKPEDGDLAVKAELSVFDGNGPVKNLAPIYILRNKQYVTYMEDTLADLGLYTRFANLNVYSQDSLTAEIMVKQINPEDDFIVLKALVFPYINVLWLGIVVMVFGFFISLGNLTLRKGKSI